jgi:hypothetical protein
MTPKKSKHKVNIKQYLILNEVKTIIFYFFILEVKIVPKTTKRYITLKNVVLFNLMSYFTTYLPESSITTTGSFLEFSNAS